jgi:hypothetical protein
MSDLKKYILSNLKYIGLSGPARVGKDTFALGIKELLKAYKLISNYKNKDFTNL